ncbi:hypothetical protein [Ramlibacter sp.]|uniref:hypothetical protein n=1 Tax=Ramlibacter sp. TaxID=1917967 RepID=UPI002B5E4FE8|nr:hypothetical protein [Ramlibacter sp.]HWI82951.1 hypothetical protein [Ramlibacter sp.]
MNLVLRNVVAVLFWQPHKYRAPRRALQAAGLSALATVLLGVLLFSARALWVVALAQLLAVVAFVCKLLWTKNFAAADIDTERVLARSLFAASVGTWPVGLALATGLPTELVLAAALHGALQVWWQVVPQRKIDGPPTAAVSATAPHPGQPGEDPRRGRVGPAIGTFRGHAIAAWLCDQFGQIHDFAGCTDDPAGFRPREGQTVLSTGLVYELRGAATELDAPAPE